MQVSKEIIGRLEKCYIAAPFNNGFLVASEKQFPCYRFDGEGRFTETVWEQPGGAMSLVQVPGMDDCFLATHRFYSPNDSKQASIVLCKKVNNAWNIKTLALLPHVHRIDVFENNGVLYLFACTLMEKRDVRDDWSFPGKVFAGHLTDGCLEIGNAEIPKLEIICDGMLKNHGYCRLVSNGRQSGVVSCDSGAYIFMPPDTGNGKWTIDRIIADPISDIAFADIDADGEQEAVAFLGFHGDYLCVYKKIGGIYKKIYDYPEKLEFLHAICPASHNGKNYVFVGNRKGDMNIIAIGADSERITAQILDSGAGAANFMFSRINRKDRLIAANRETDQIVMYTLE